MVTQLWCEYRRCSGLANRTFRHKGRATTKLGLKASELDKGVQNNTLNIKFKKVEFSVKGMVFTSEPIACANISRYVTGA